MKPIVLFGIQFTLALVAYALLAWWHLAPRLAKLDRHQALEPLVWVHAFRIVGGAILAPGTVGLGVSLAFRRMIGIGDMATATLALVALLALRARWSRADALVWLLLVVGALDTINAIIQSLRDNVFIHPLGVNWVIVTMYVPALVVSSVLIVLQLLRRPAPARHAGDLAPAT
jgi:hypothetical protein